MIFPPCGLSVEHGLKDDAVLLYAFEGETALDPRELMLHPALSAWSDEAILGPCASSNRSQYGPDNHPGCRWTSHSGML